MSRRIGKAAAVTSAVAALIAIAGCSSSGSGSGGSNPAPAVSTTAVAADITAAKALLAEYSGKVSAFPVDAPLTKRLPSSASLVYLQCASPVCAIAGNIVAAAAKTMGINYSKINAGPSVSTQQAAMDSIATLKPTALMIAGLDPTGIGPQLRKLVASGVTVGTVGLQKTAPYGVQAPFNTEAANTKEAALLAAWAVLKNGQNTNSVIYETPELSFSPVVVSGYLAEMKALCPSCKARKVDIPLASVGTDASSRIVSDLQNHPDTKTAIFSDLDVETGLPAALKTAGIKVQTAGLSPSPSGLQDIKDGNLDAAVAVDLPVLFWTDVDMTARVGTGQPATAGEKSGIPSGQLLEKADVAFDPSNGFSGYPDYVQRFEKYWKG